MAVTLNHTIVHSDDPQVTATFMTELLGLPTATRFGPFLVVEVANGVSLDVMQAERAEIQQQHYAFLVSEAEFDEIYGRIVEWGIDHWADPGAQHPGEINHHDGGRGVYFAEPSGHYLEIITRPYGSGSPETPG